MSYILSVLILMITVFELVNAFHTLRNFKVKKLLKGIKMRDKIDKTIKEGTADLKTRWKMVKAGDKFQREFSYVFGMSQMFFLAGIDLSKTRTFKLRAVKLFSVLKSVLFSLLINSFQTLPRSQITLILSI